MDIKLSNSANKALGRIRDSFLSGDFKVSRKKTLNALLTVFANDWDELVEKADWSAKHLPLHSITARKDSSKLLNDLMNQLRHAGIDIKEDQASSCTIEYADLKFDDPDFRDSLMEFFSANAKDPSEEKLIFVEVPNGLYDELKKLATKYKKKATAESFVGDLLDRHVPKLKDSRLKEVAGDKKNLSKLKRNQFTFLVAEVDPSVKKKLAENFTRSSGAALVSLIEYLIGNKLED